VKGCHIWKKGLSAGKSAKLLIISYSLPVIYVAMKTNTLTMIRFITTGGNDDCDL
jgi:hypothetical protein